mgnify:CR=1 FL=1
MKTNDRAGRMRGARVYLAVGVGLVLLALGAAFVLVRSRAAARAATERTLAFVAEQMDRYEDGAANDKTKSLIRLLDKTKELAERVFAADGLSPDALDAYAYDQRLTGAVVLDAGLGIDAQTTCDGDSRALLEGLADSRLIADIVQHPEKSFLTQAEYDGVSYDYAAVGRRDAPGIVIAYARKTDFDEGALTLDTLFSGYDIRMDGIIVVSDGERVIGTNRASLAGADLTAFARDFSECGTRNGLTRWTDGARSFVGGKTFLRGYGIYVLFPVIEVCRSGLMGLAVGTAVYVLFCVLLMWLRQRTRHAGLLQLEKQFDTLNAIGEIYSSCVLLMPQTDRAELIKAPDHIIEELHPELGAAAILEQIRENYVAEPYREQFMAFCDLSSAAERLNGHRYLNFSYFSVHGRWFLAFLVPQHYDQDGRLTGALLIFRDISDEHAREAAYQQKLECALADAERASRAKTDFLRRMSHDIRTPINGIRGMVAISRHYQGDEQKQEECREKVMQASGYLLELVNDILDMSKLESGTVRLERRPFDLADVLSVVASLCEAQAAAHSITVRCDGKQITHRYLIGSPIHLQRVLQNVAVNAAKYNREGGSVDLTCRELGSDGKTAEFEFICADTGLGMSEEFQKTAFEPFTQERSANARTNYGGTGLGLSIAHELAEKLGGELRFESELGRGTTFYLTLRFAIDANPPEQQVALEDLTRSVRGLHIMLVEDNALNMEVAAFMLRREGAIVTELWNGREAVEFFEASAPGSVDIILMDIMMPVMNGLAAARAIRAMERPDAGTVPIIAMSANAFADDIDRSLEAGMNAHLAKPVDAPKLLAAIHRCSLNRHRGEKTEAPPG